MPTTEERKSKLQAAWRNQREAALSNWDNPNSEFAASRSADAAEAKARQEKHDAQIRAQVAAKAPDLYGPKRQYADPNEFGPGKMLQGGAPNQLKQLDLSGMKQKKGDDEQLAQRQDPVEQLKQGIQRSRAAMAARSAALRVQEEQAGEAEQAGADQQALKKKLKAATRRGVLWILNLLGVAVDFASAGAGLLVTWIIRVFSLGWLNTEMIYGSYFMKGKSKLISPLSWEPIPMPVDKKGLILIAFVVAADLAFVIVMTVMGSFSFCFVHDLVKFGASPLKAGAALAQGGGDLCLGAIIPALFGL